MEFRVTQKRSLVSEYIVTIRGGKFWLQKVTSKPKGTPIGKYHRSVPTSTVVADITAALEDINK